MLETTGNIPAGIYIPVKFAAVARLFCLLTIAAIGNAYACPVGFMQVSGSSGPFSCQKMNIILAEPVPIISNQACPAGSIDSRNIGALDACHKSVNGQDEVVLRVGEHCPTGDAQIVDADGDNACKRPAKLNNAGDDELTGY